MAEPEFKPESYLQLLTKDLQTVVCKYIQEPEVRFEIIREPTSPYFQKLTLIIDFKQQNFQYRSQLSLYGVKFSDYIHLIETAIENIEQGKFILEFPHSTGVFTFKSADWDVKICGENDLQYEISDISYNGQHDNRITVSEPLMLKVLSKLKETLIQHLQPLMHHY